MGLRGGVREERRVHGQVGCHHGEGLTGSPHMMTLNMIFICRCCVNLKYYNTLFLWSILRLDISHIYSLMGGVFQNCI